jgi:hypothetical protein
VDHGNREFTPKKTPGRIDLPQCECGAVYWLSVEDLKAPGVWVANTECWLQGHYAIDSQCQAPQTATGNLLPKTQTTQTPHQDTPTFSGKEAPEKATPQVAQTPGQTSPSPAVIEPHPGPDDNPKPGNVYSIVCTPIKQKINATDQAKIDKIVIHVHFDSRDPHTIMALRITHEIAGKVYDVSTQYDRFQYAKDGGQFYEWSWCRSTT